MFAGKQARGLRPERAHPLRIGTARRRQQEPAAREVVAQLHTLLLGQRKAALARHDREREAAQVGTSEAHLPKLRLGAYARLHRQPLEKAVAETAGGLVPGIDEIGALDPFAAPSKRAAALRRGQRGRQREQNCRQRRNRPSMQT